MILRYMVNNDHIKLYQKYQSCGCVWAENIAKFSFRGHPMYNTILESRTSYFGPKVSKNGFLMNNIGFISSDILNQKRRYDQNRFHTA